MLDSKRLVALLLLAAVLGCASSRGAPAESTEFHRVQAPGIENLYQLGGDLYSGSAPEGAAGFAALKGLGIKTAISVDGSAPDVELAAKYGINYVHLPIGYDGTMRSNALRIIKAAQVSPGPIFIHCHHGLHRGPAAAALVCEGLQGWSPTQAQGWLKTAGTATNYPGLYRLVREFSVPSESELRQVPAQFSSRAQTPDLVNTMVQIDEHFDLIKAMQKVGFKPLPDHPDVAPVSESLLLYELFKEAHRTKQGGKRGEQFVVELGKAEANAENLYLSLKNLQNAATVDLAPADSAFQNMTRSCGACHKTFRN
jgi:hypothetical protein